MAIAVECICGKRFKARDDQAGKNFTCSHCGIAIAVPQPKEDPAAEFVSDDSGPTKSVFRPTQFTDDRSDAAKRHFRVFVSVCAAVCIVAIGGTVWYLEAGKKLKTQKH